MWFSAFQSALFASSVQVLSVCSRGFQPARVPRRKRSAQEVPKNAAKTRSARIFGLRRGVRLWYYYL